MYVHVARIAVILDISVKGNIKHSEYNRYENTYIFFIVVLFLW